MAGADGNQTEAGVMTATGWFITIFWGLAVLAIGLGIVISAEEYLTEKLYGSGSKGDNDHA